MTRRILQIGCNVLLALAVGTALSGADTPATGDRAGHDYPTSDRVEYVQECMMKNGGELASLYKCSCVIDRIATDLSYDDFVEWGTYARNASLAGERGGVFRDSDEARDKAKRFRTIESGAQRACGIPAPKKP